MLLKTKHFGEVEYSEDAVIEFEEGLPGFHNSQRFILLADNTEDLFHWLQSTDNEELCFILLDVRKVKPDYEPRIEPELLAPLGEENALQYYSIAVVPEDLQQMRVNLKAPVIINKNARKGRQLIANNEDYDIRHYIFEEIQQLPEVAGC